MTGALLQICAVGSSDVSLFCKTGDAMPATMRESACYWFTARLDGAPEEADLREVEVRHRPGVAFPYDVRRDKLDRAQLEYVLLERGRGLHSPDRATRVVPNPDTPCGWFGKGAYP